MDEGEWSIRPDGYRVRWIDGVCHYRHRYLWERKHGPIPDGYTIDHINGTPGDDRMENLQCITNAENVRLGSERLYRNNTVGYPNVNQNHIGKWYGSIAVNGKRHYCGCADTPEEAYAMVQAKRRELNAPTRRLATRS